MNLQIHNYYAPGDDVVLTGVVKELKLNYPDIKIQIKSRYPDLWQHNPYVENNLYGKITKLKINHRSYLNREMISPTGMHYKDMLISYISRQLGLGIKYKDLNGDLHLTDNEKNNRYMVPDEPYWLIVNGGKSDFTVKWWNPDFAQEVVDAFPGKTFIQVGKLGNDGFDHVHFKLNGVIDLVNHTSLRDLMRLVYHCRGIICPVTMIMHMEAALPRKTGKKRDCIVLAGGREIPSYGKYPHHYFLDTIGELDCCKDNGCWKIRCQTVKDGLVDIHGDNWNNKACVKPIQIRDDLRIPKCMQMLTPTRVIDIIRNAD